MNIIHGKLTSGSTSPSPKISCWPAEGEPSGVGLVIFPGGGYGHLAEHEGAGYAEFFSGAGIACFVVEYRLGKHGHRHPAMLEDALAAVSTVRERAKDFGVDPDKIGVIGSSAGGHLAAHSLVGWRPYVKNGDSPRPDFGVLCYPVILSTGAHAHQGSMTNLLGENPDPDPLKAVSCDKRVDAETPPCFLWHTVEDPVVPVENSFSFALALRKHGVPFEMHVYPKGRHGLGLGATFDWGGECLRWIQDTARPSVSVRRPPSEL